MDEIKEIFHFERCNRRYMKRDLPHWWHIIQMFMGEAFGTAIMMFVGCLGGLSKSYVTEFVHCFSFGATIMMVITSVGHVSQAHLNPAVTICAIILGGLPLLLGPIYLVAQTIGALLGYGLLQLLVPQKFHEGMCLSKSRRELSVGQVFSIEFVASTTLILMCCGVWDPRCETRHDSVPLKFAFGITALAVLEASHTGCSMNPVRSFAPALYRNYWTRHWVYWVAPCLAGTIVTPLYMVACGKPRK